jgi:hypothetical protein
MIEIQASDLQVNQTYYVDMTGVPRVPTTPRTLPRNTLPRKIKAICTEKVEAGGSNRVGYMICISYRGVNSTELDHEYGRWYIESTQAGVKYYLPTRDALERAIVNAVLQDIIGDNVFKYL